MGTLKQRSRGIPGIVMGMFFVLLGLAGLGYFFEIYQVPAPYVYYLEMTYGMSIMVFVVAGALSVLLGWLAMAGGYRKSYPKQRPTIGAG